MWMCRLRPFLRQGNRLHRPYYANPSEAGPVFQPSTSNCLPTPKEERTITSGPRLSGHSSASVALDTGGLRRTGADSARAAINQEFASFYPPQKSARRFWVRTIKSASDYHRRDIAREPVLRCARYVGLVFSARRHRQQDRAMTGVSAARPSARPGYGRLTSFEDMCGAPPSVERPPASAARFSRPRST